MHQPKNSDVSLPSRRRLKLFSIRLQHYLRDGTNSIQDQPVLIADAMNADFACSVSPLLHAQSIVVSDHPLPTSQYGNPVENPGTEDPGMVELIQSDSCAEVIIQRCLGNPPHYRHHSCDCCNRCDPTLHPGREYRWVEVDPAPATASTTGVKSTALQRELIFKKLVAWCLAHWRSDWSTTDSSVLGGDSFPITILRNPCR